MQGHLSTSVAVLIITVAAGDTIAFISPSPSLLEPVDVGSSVPKRMRKHTGASWSTKQQLPEGGTSLSPGHPACRGVSEVSPLSWRGGSEGTLSSLSASLGLRGDVSRELYHPGKILFPLTKPQGTHRTRDLDGATGLVAFPSFPLACLSSVCLSCLARILGKPQEH